MFNCPMKGKGMGLKQIGENGKDNWGAEVAPEEVRALSSLKVMKEDKKEWIDVMRNKKTRAKNSSSNSLQTIEPEVVSSIKAKNGWEEIFMAVDSGASETVVGEEMLEGVPTKEGEASRRGVQYEVMNGIRIPNLGEKKFKGYTSEGIVRNLTAQVCEVNKALLSVKKVVQAGNKVVFDSDGSFIEDSFVCGSVVRVFNGRA